MPWRGPTERLPVPSLGYRLVAWYERNLVVPSGRDYGKPLRLTPEQVGFVVRFYQLDDKGHRLYRRGLLRRAKGWGKSPLLGAMAAGELCGPVMFDGWDAKGLPRGVQHPSPNVQVAAVSVDQTENTYGPIYQMLQDSADQLGLDVGRTRVFVKDSPGKLEPVTAAAGSREGQVLSFAVLDETHLWTPSNGGTALAATLRRNVGKYSGTSVETTNAYVPGARSVAEESETKRTASVLFDGLEAPEVPDLSDRDRLREALKVAYGDATWVDLDRLVEECNDPNTDPSDARRFYLNQIVQSSEQAFDVNRWRELTADAAYAIPDGAVVVLGFDGARFHDATALVACEVATGFLQPLGVWQRPDGAPAGWEVPEGAVDAAVHQAFSRWRVWRMYADPPYWESVVDRWTATWGDRVVVKWWTNRRRQMALSVQAFATALRAGELSHDGDSTLEAHVANCRRQDTNMFDEDHRPLYILQKDHPNSPRKIDAAVASVLAWECRGDAIAAGVRATSDSLNGATFHAF